MSLAEPEDVPVHWAELEAERPSRDEALEAAADGYDSPSGTYAPRVHCPACGSTWGPVPHGCGGAS